MLKRYLIFLLLLVISSLSVKASHLMGGEITWKCLPNGQFKFTMKVYRDCAGITFGGPLSLDVSNHPTVTSIPMIQVADADISPVCNTDPPTNTQITCAGANFNTVGATEEFIFESNPITLSGVPPAAGWIFHWSSCCRNGAITNLAGANGLGFTLRAIMFPYNGTNTNPCYDSSPEFAERPSTIICNGYAFTYNHNAQDVELDSLIYSFGQPYDSWGGGWPPANCPYAAGYSVNSPLPSTTQNVNNIAASIDPNSGEISYLSYTAGNFVTVTKVTAYKCGIKVAEIYREIQVVLLNCPPMNPAPPVAVPNAPPDVTKPFVDPNTGLFTRMYDTVFAGELVSFFLNATDFDYDVSLGTQPWGNGGFQILTLEATGAEFGAGFSNPNSGCLIPPCATLSPIPPISALAGVGVTFNWQTDCSHLGLNIGCVTLVNTYRFVIRVRDDFCPAPAITFRTISVTVIAPPPLDSTPIRCAVQPNGDITLTWNEVIDTLDKFDAYLLYASTSPGGPYTLIDSIFTLGQTSWTHSGANGQTTQWYYKMQTRSFCNTEFYSGFTDVATNMILNCVNNNNGTASLSWNPIRTPLLSSSLTHYKIWLEHPVGVWTLIDSTQNLNYLDTVLIDLCSDTITYRIEIEDSVGCTSVSSLDGAFFQTNVFPDPPSLRCLVADNNGSVQMSWVAPVDTGVSFDGFFIYRANNIAGPYILIDSVKNYFVNTYNDLTANVMNNPVFYVVKSYSKCNLAWSVNSDTLQAIRLTVANVGGSANLSWNALHSPPLPSSTGKYWIYKEYPPNVWTLIDSTTSLTYIQSIVVCNDTVNYRVELKDDAGCVSKSTIAGGRFVDNSIPDPPDLRCIAVNPNGNITFSWVAPIDTGMDYNSYHIFSSNNIGGPFTEIDSSFNYNQLSYTHTSANAYAGPLFYYVETRTGCGVQYSPPSVTLQPISLNVTNPGNDNVANLSWNAIHTPNLPTSSGVYNVFRKYPATGWSFVGSTPNLTYVDTNHICIDSVHYRIEIGDALGCTSVSTINGNMFYDQTVPAAPDLRCISVNPNGSINFSWIAPVDTGLDFNSYHVFASPNIGGPFNKIDSLFGYGTLSYTHITANAYTTPMYYYVETRTGCGVQYSLPSTTLTPILLTVTNPANNTIANLSWTEIHSPNLPTSTGVYNIFRRYTSTGWSQIGSTPALTYTDTNQVCIDSAYYRVEIGDASGCNSVSIIDGDNFIDQTIPAAPDLRCVAADALGNVTLTWIPPVDTALRFNSYHVFVSNNPAGPFTHLDSLFNYFTVSYTHNGANANLTQLYYYVETRSGCGVQYSIPSETLHVIKLNVTNVGFGVANLQWNEPHTPLLPSSATDYKVYKEYPSGVWNFIGTTPNLTYTDTNNICSATIAYRVELEDASGCINVSTIDQDLFFDGIAPAITLLDTVSVKPSNGQTIISWLPNTSPDVIGYIIYLYNGASWDSIGSVTGINNLSWWNLLSNAENVSELYSVAAYDSCGNLSPIGTGERTILLKDSLNKCDASIDMWWNSYENMQGGLASYNVWMSENGGPYSLLANVPFSTTDYRHFGIKKDTSYCYFIQAVGNVASRTASSNEECILADVLIFPEFTYLKTATVQAQNQVYVEAYVDTLADVMEYKLQRSSLKNSDFSTILTIPNAGSETISFVDYTALTNKESYYYRVIPVSTCNKNMDTSNVGRTILLEAKPNDNFTNYIQWNGYEEWSGGVVKYKTYRYVNGAWSTTPIAVVPATQRDFVDNIEPFFEGDGVFCYLIEADEGNGNIFNFVESSNSNEICVTQDPHIWIPNSFTPDGKNPTFHPVSIFTSTTGYRMMIYDRWGQPIFETGNYEEGWDGTFKGQPAGQGVYAYTIKIYGTNGKEIIKRGTVSLLK